MDDFIKQFTASQVRGAVIGCAVCGPLISLLTNLRCRALPLANAIVDGALTALCIAVIVAWGSEFVFRTGCRKNPWFKLEDHPLGDEGKILPFLPRQSALLGAVFGVAGAALWTLLLSFVFVLLARELFPFWLFLLFKIVFCGALGGCTARFAALNNFRYR